MGMFLEKETGQMKNRFRIPGRVVIVAFVIILLAIVGIDIQFQSYTEQMGRQQRNITYLEAQAESLNALEWELVANKKLEPQLVAELAKNRQKIEKTLAQLADNERRQQIGKLFNGYISALDEELRLIAEGNESQAQHVDQEKVAPRFQLLRSAVFEAGQEIENAIERSSWIFYMDSMLSITLAVMVIVILLHKSNQLQLTGELIEAAYTELRKVFNSASEGIRVVDTNFNIISVNRAFAELSGMSEEESETKKCYETLEGPYCHTSQCTLVAILNGQERVEHTDILRKRPDGTELHCWLNAVPFRAPDGTIIGIVENVKDVTTAKKAEAVLLQRMQFEQLVTSLSTQFINCTPQEIDSQIKYSLQLVGEFTGVDRCYTFLFSDDGETIDNTHEWCAPGIESQIQERKNILVDSIPWFKDQIRRFGFIYIPEVSDLGPEAKAEKEIFKNRQIRSHLVVPVIYEKALKGFLGFETVQEKKMWSQEYISSLSIVGEIIATALMRRQTEEMLCASEERFRATFEQAAVGVIHVGLDGRWLLVNQKFCDMLGYTKEEAVKLKFGDITYPDDLENDLEHLARLRSGDIAVFSIDKRYVRKDGSLIWVNLTVSLVRESSGEPQYYIGVIQDITDRKQAESLIQEQKEFSENLLQNLTVPAFVLSPDHKVLIWNKACEKLTGLSGKDIIDTDLHWKGFYDHKRPCLSDVVIDENFQSLSSLYQNYDTSDVISDGLHAENWLSDVGGQRRYIVMDSAPIRDSKGTLVAAIQTLHDFTDWKLAELAIFKENERVLKDLQLASIVQSSLFPRSLPVLPGVSLASRNLPAREIGGDYCGLLVTKDHQLAIGIGDVMGKGIPAALFATMAYAFVRNYAGWIKDPSLLLNRLNRDMFPQLEFSGQFMTFFYGVYDPETRELRYSNAGQNKPVVFRAESGECEILDVKNFFLGGRENASYKEGNTFLFPGDIVLFYTDGLIEGKNKDKEEFGLERVITLLKKYSAVDPASIEEIITSQFIGFLNDETPSDDMTMLILKVNHVS